MAARVGLLVLLGLAFAASTASAEDAEVIKRLQRHGDLPRSQAQQLVRIVGKQMKRAADMTQGRNDPLRAAVSQEILGTPVPPNPMAAAKVRLRLYSGLNTWALETLFKAKPGAIAACVQQFGVATGDCEALIAASAKSSVAKARKAGAGPAPRNAGGFGGGQPSRFGGGQPSRFGGGQPSRFGGGGYQAQRYGQAPPRYQQPRRAAPAARAPMRRPVAATNTKEAYKRRREAYLARQRQRLEERKAKLRAAQGPQKVERGLVSGEDAKAMGIETAEKPSQSASSPKAAAQPEPAAAKPAPKKKDKAGMDEGFLDDLLSDPLGGK